MKDGIISIDTDTYYKGSTCFKVILSEDMNGNIIIRTEYGEKVATAFSWEGVRGVIDNLLEGKYA